MSKARPKIYDFNVKLINGHLSSIGQYKGKVLLIINTASQCGFTSQFVGLENLYQQYKDQGLMILGFPCNQFGQQDPAENEEILSFCQKNYGVSFPMHSKIDVNGNNTDPLYYYLKQQAPGIFGTRRIKWNFTKFLIAHDGSTITRFSPTTKPEDLTQAIKIALSKLPCLP